MKTHFPRERERKKARAFEIELRAAAPASKALWCAHPQQQSEFGGGHSNNDSIHSFTPIHLPTYYTHHTSLSFYYYLHLLTPSTYFPRQTNHAPSLAHNHSTFMEMCVIAVRYHKKIAAAAERASEQTNKRGLV